MLRLSQEWDDEWAGFCFDKNFKYNLHIRKE